MSKLHTHLTIKIIFEKNVTARLRNFSTVFTTTLKVTW